jgi:formate transporter
MQIDALLPPQMAARAEEIGARKVEAPLTTTLALAVLAGAFIALGGVLSLTVTAGSAGVLPFGVTRLLAGLAFSLGLVLVTVGGAELFTGNNLIVMALMSGKARAGRVLRNWALVYAGNFLGALATAALVVASGHPRMGGAAVAAALLSAAEAKLRLGFGEAVALGVLCNGLVCLAVWLSYSARSTTDRILAVVPPVTAFVAAGFEHSVANMYFVPAAMMVKASAGADLWQAIGRAPEELADLAWAPFLLRNLLPVTIGNLLGGTVLVGSIYWFVYLRKRPATRAP